MATAHSNDPEQACIDKRFLHGEFQKGEDYKLERQKKRDELAFRMASKAVDMHDVPEDPMDIRANKTINNHGMGVKGMLAVAALTLATGGIGGAGLWAILNAGKAIAPVIQPQPDFTDTDTDTGYRLKLLPPEE